MQMTGTATTLDGDTLDLVLWRTRGRTAALTEQTLEINPGLADLGPLLPAGIVIALPVAQKSPAAIRETVKLWG